MFVELECGYQQYDWGKLGKDSKVAACAKAVGAQIEQDQPYAELWMGTHPKCPAYVRGTTETLAEALAKNPSALGAGVRAKFGEDLPYLFKVLSISKALSIQAHPDKALAKMIHGRDPKNYPDDNHKPEMAIALTDFEGFCGFRPPIEIAAFFDAIPEFEELVGSDVVHEFKKLVSAGNTHDALKAAFSAVMNAPDAKVATLSKKVVDRARKDPKAFGGKYGGPDLAALLQQVYEQFPDDVGLFCGGLMLNYVRLNKGEAMFLRAKDPHAYISGDIIECMAASDNVVRAGFTPKFKDVPTLVDMLTYTAAPVEEQKMKPQPFYAVHGGTASLFDPPIDEFAVVQVNTSGTTTIDQLTGPSIFVVTEGSGIVRGDGHEFRYAPGLVFFVGAGTAVELVATEPTVSYHAVIEV